MKTLIRCLVCCSLAGCLPVGEGGGTAELETGVAAGNTHLFDGLTGFASGTTGGLYGQIYVVTRNDDSMTPGTLRYGVEALTGPTWIVFDHTVFPPATKKSIYLTKPLNLRSDTTIDGRGSYVSLRKTYYYTDVYSWDAVGSDWECTARNPPVHDVGPMLKIKSVHNVVVTHLDFLKIYSGTPSKGTPPNYYDLDKQCFGDVISIYNVDQNQADHFFGNIWINHSNFSDCGDECIGVTSPSTVDSGLGRSFVSISNNRFFNSYKGIVLGKGLDPLYQLAVSVYQNDFDNVGQRQPRVQSSVAHVFNNVIENWRGYGVGAYDDSRVTVEQNVFAAGATSSPWKLGSTNHAVLWARDNWGAPSTASYPTCVDTGGLWYVECPPMINVKAMSSASALSLLKSYAGFKITANDVW